MEKKLGDYILKLRKKSKKTIKELKEELKISHQYLNDIENGKRVPSDVLLKQIAEVFMLDDDEKIKLYDLAIEASKTKKIPVDISCFIIENEDAKTMIREMINVYNREVK